MTSAVTHADAPAAGLPDAIGRRWPTGVGFLATAASLTVVAPLSERVQTCVGADAATLSHRMAADALRSSQQAKPGRREPETPAVSPA